MAVSYTRTLKLRIESNITAAARYNLERLDTLLANYVQDSTDLYKIKSRGNILIEPASPDLGGTGTDGELAFGTASTPIATTTFNSDYTRFTGNFGLFDQATGGANYLNIKYNSAVSGSVDAAADRSLTLDLQGADRTISLNGGLSLGGGFTTSGAYSVTLTTMADTSLTLPVSGTLSTLAGAETLTNKILVGPVLSAPTMLGGTFTGITLTGGTFSGTISSSEITGSSGSFSTLAASSALTYNGNQVATLAGAETLTNKSISADTNTLSDIDNAAIASNAAIAGTKISPDFGSQNIATTGTLQIGGINLSSPVSAAYGIVLPDTNGAVGQVLVTDGAGNLDWVDSLTGATTTTSIAEGSNLYYTDTRARAAISGTGSIIYNNATGVISYTQPPLDTDTVTEASNLYYTDVRARLAISGSGSISYDNTTGVISLPALSTTNVTEGTGLYFTDGRARSAISVSGSLSYDSATGVMSLPSLSTTNVTEGTSLYFTDARARTAISGAGAISYDNTSGVIAYTAPTTGYATDWVTADGTSKTVTHSLNSRDVIVQLYELSTYGTIQVDTIARTTVNSVTLTASQTPPAGSWRVVIYKVN